MKFVISTFVLILAISPRICYNKTVRSRYCVAGQSHLFCKRHSYIARNIAKNDLAPHRCEVIFLSFGYLSTYKIRDFRNIFYTTPWRWGCIDESRWRIKKSALYRINGFAPRQDFTEGSSLPYPKNIAADLIL